MTVESQGSLRNEGRGDRLVGIDPPAYDALSQLASCNRPSLDATTDRIGKLRL